VARIAVSCLGGGWQGTRTRRRRRRSRRRSRTSRRRKRRRRRSRASRRRRRTRRTSSWNGEEGEGNGTFFPLTPHEKIFGCTLVPITHPSHFLRFFASSAELPET
jgi:hypothetical protein